ncbi:hypothetical protein ROHU_001960 [Labeo rohita]|uniref:Uncharacterized protein n=1 Tax=Labeo rohita TaxID=84645 RepID=A0A498MJ43_LABRO|nr:hypothetical protein ROHU_007560 [Labeo rohita]RXN37543.1 hypothetical protein ROHU_001960 [Labeo rohita]
MEETIDLTVEHTEEELEALYGNIFSGACHENSRNILDAFYKHRNVDDFLRNDNLHIPFFPTTVQYAKDNLNYDYDFDGIVIELKDLTAIKADLHYLLVAKVVGQTLQNHWHSLKKHINLNNYNAPAISALTHTYGHTLSFVDGGYLLNMSCISAELKNPHPVFQTETAARANAAQIINAVLGVFAQKLRAVPPEDMKRPTIIKANLNDLKRMNILRADKNFVLQLLMQSVQEVDRDSTHKIVLFLSKFGHKDESTLEISTMVHRKGVLSISCHAACTISPKDPRTDLIWSRYGLQEVVGHRGTLYPVIGMPEAANFQSNLDRHPLTIDYLLNNVFDGPVKYSRINFIQLYANTPHIYGPTARHPVSRVIATCGVHNPQHARKILQKAKAYIDHMDDLARKTICRVQARIEAVFLLKTHFPLRMDPQDFFKPAAIHHLLEEIPILLPFKDNEHQLGLRHILQPVASHLTSTLYTLLSEAKGRGGFNSSWTAFQAELALEELFFGKPHCPQSRPYAISLGTNCTDSNSLTRQRGFLGLSPIGSASVGESPPPLQTWIKDPNQRLRVERIFAFTDTLDANPSVIGDALVRLLLSDLHERNDRISVDLLRQVEPPLLAKIVGCRTTQDLCKDLAERKGFGYPHTFERALELTRSVGHDIVECLQLGLSGVKYFPAITFWDEQKNAKARWNKKTYIELYGPTDQPSAAAQAAALLGDVLSNMEKKGLCYCRTLQRYKENGMPWLELSIIRLPKNLDSDMALTALTFISAIGLIQNGDYVSFPVLANLADDLPISQLEMQKLRILSPLLLLKTPKINRLHETVPHKIEVPQPQIGRPAPAAPRKRSPSPELSDPEQQEELEEQVIERVVPRTVPANIATRWTDEEVQLLTTNPQMTHHDAYQAYLTRCKELCRPARTFAAFKRKRQRVP